MRFVLLVVPYMIGRGERVALTGSDRGRFQVLMRRLREQMGTHEVTIELTDEAKDLLVEKGYDPAMGARPLRRAIQHYIEDPLADFVLGRSLKPGSTIMVDRKDDEEVGISVIDPPDEPESEKVTVPPEEPSAEAGDEESHDDE